MVMETKSEGCLANARSKSHALEVLCIRLTRSIVEHVG
jgi:hypothetical protein